MFKVPFLSFLLDCADTGLRDFYSFLTRQATYFADIPDLRTHLPELKDLRSFLVEEVVKW